VSWKKREESGWIDQWRNIDRIHNPFFFRIEEMPLDELEEFLGFEVNRKPVHIGSLGDYPEKASLDAAKRYLGDEWRYVEEALKTEAGHDYS
jgi:hypothetical protein